MVDILFQIVRFLNKNRVDYCLIGGLAVMLYGGRANTIDIDLYVLVNDLEIIRSLFEKKGWEVNPAGEYQLKAKVKNVPVDILLADHYIGADVVARAQKMKLGKDHVSVATPEDIIILKTLADRSVDRRDIEELHELFGKKLDEGYISKKLKQLKKLLES